MSRLRACKGKVAEPVTYNPDHTIKSDPFDACIKSTTAPIVQKGTALQALRDFAVFTWAIRTS